MSKQKNFPPYSLSHEEWSLLTREQARELLDFDTEWANSNKRFYRLKDHYRQQPPPRGYKVDDQHKCIITGDYVDSETVRSLESIRVIPLDEVK